jgi:hypothetical protein
MKPPETGGEKRGSRFFTNGRPRLKTGRAFYLFTYQRVFGRL